MARVTASRSYVPPLRAACEAAWLSPLVQRASARSSCRSGREEAASASQRPTSSPKHDQAAPSAAEVRPAVPRKWAGKRERSRHSRKQPSARCCHALRILKDRILMHLSALAASH